MMTTMPSCSKLQAQGMYVSHTQRFLVRRVRAMDEVQKAEKDRNDRANSIGTRARTRGGGGGRRSAEDNGRLRSSITASSSSRSETETKRTEEVLQSSSIFLVGLMGTGKTTVGKALATRLNYGYFDTDRLIEQISKRTVKEIFEEDGEGEFRKIESDVLSELASYKRVVVSTGGGIVSVRNNWMHLHNGITVCLQGDHRTLARRVARDGIEARPLLKECLTGDSENDEEMRIQKIEKKIQELWDARGKMYAESDIAVSVNGDKEDELGASVDVIVDRICRSIEKRLREDNKQGQLRNEPKIGDIEVKNLKTGERINRVE